MTKTVLAGGCSFTYGSELSDDKNGQSPSTKTWSARLCDRVNGNYFCVAKVGTGNQGIVRRIFNYISNHSTDVFVLVMWTFTSRYDWAMPRHKKLEDTRWTTITPWDTEIKQSEAIEHLAGSDGQMKTWKIRRENSVETNTAPFADALYRYAANNYHETYLSWMSIIWLQNLLEKKGIPYLFTLADNSLFYKEQTMLSHTDNFLGRLHSEIDFSNDKWFVFGERMMGFNQWASLNCYEYGTTHPLDRAHEDATKLMWTTFNKRYNK